MRSKREVLLLRVFKVLLAVVMWATAASALVAVHRRAMLPITAGYDFYQYWIGGEVIRGRAPGDAPVDLYSDEAHTHLGEQYYQAAQHHPRRERLAAGSRRALTTLASPFLSWMFSLGAPIDYESAYQRYVGLEMTCLIVAISVLTWRLGYAMWAMGAAMALAALSGPVFSEFSVLNVNCFELAGLTAYVLLHDRARAQGRAGMLCTFCAGAMLGLLLATKPTFLLLTLLIAFSRIISGKTRQTMIEAAGGAAAIFAAIAISSSAFGSWQCWPNWIHAAGELGSRPLMPSGFGSISFTRSLFELTGHDYTLPLLAITWTIAFGAVWLSRRRSARLATSLWPAGAALPSLPRDVVKSAEASAAERIATLAKRPPAATPTWRDVELAYDLALIGVGGTISCMVAGLSWIHYLILVFPLLLLVGAPHQPSRGLLRAFARNGVFAITILLLMYPLPDDVLHLLPFHSQFSIWTWIRCSQGAAVATLILSLLYL